MDDDLGMKPVEAGRLLVANPLLPDPNFDRTVVLLLACNEEGALGVVLNRPSETGVATPLPRWETLAATPAVLFVGGPVQHQAVICLARSADGGAGVGLGSDGWKPVAGEVGTLDMELDPEDLGGSFRQVRFFAGYAGWSAGQLEAEIEAGAWWVVDADPDDPFSGQPEHLWKHVLRRQPGRLALVAYYPDDPTAN